MNNHLENEGGEETQNGETRDNKRKTEQGRERGTIVMVCFFKWSFDKENKNCPYSARIYVYMSRSCIFKMRVKTGLHYLIIANLVVATPTTEPLLKPSHTNPQF